MSQSEYKTVCDTCGKQTWYEIEQPCHVIRPATKTCKTCGHTETVEPLKMVCCTGTLRVIDRSMLNPHFVPYNNSGERVEVRFHYGETTELRRGYVGKTTGWRPVFILLARIDSTGSSDVIREQDEFVRVIKQREKAR